MAHNRKQLTVTILYIFLICLFVAGGLWFRGHPLFSGQGLRLNTSPAAPEATYVPYAATSGKAALPTALTSEELPTPLSRFYTTERATVFTFSGIERAKELDAVLEALKNTNSRATFFVTAEEMELYPERIDAISRAGQSLGISVLPTQHVTASQMLSALQAQAQTLRDRYQAYYEIFVRPATGFGSTALLQAAAQGGFRVLKEMKEAVPEKVSRMTDPGEIIPAVINENEGMFQRGEIVHFQMGIFQYSDTVLGELVERMVSEKCTYPVVSADEVAERTEAQYEYPVPREMILPDVRDRIYPGHLKDMTKDEIFEVIRSGYIGISWILSPYFLPGFSDSETRHLDKTGIIENDENYVFLTFDDWGTDGTVDKLLNVLDKHHATATFFVRTEYVPNNPNLLRAIAAAGHTIGAHSHKHMSLSNEVRPTYFTELDEQQRQELEEDIVICYNTLQNVIGDMVDADGKPSLSALFRQPTLAVGRSGLETVFDCGYTHAVAGYYTTTDYKAESARSLAAEIKKNIKPGAILVMHFSDNAQYTADALDQLLTEFESSGSPYRFVGLNKVLS